MLDLVKDSNAISNCIRWLNKNKKHRNTMNVFKAEYFGEFVRIVDDDIFKHGGFPTHFVFDNEEDEVLFRLRWS